MKFLMILKKIVFKLWRMLSFSVLVLSTIYPLSIIVTIFYTQTKSKHLRKELHEDFLNVLALNQQDKINGLITEYEEKISILSKEAETLKLHAKKEWFLAIITKQKSFNKLAIILEYSIYIDRLKNADLGNYFILKDIKRNLTV